MYHLIYSSQATLTFTEPMLADLLKHARQHNERLGITGVLLYNQEQFVQVLEGSAEAIANVYNRLLHDVRHYNVVELASGHLVARRFGEWAMSFHAVEPAQMAQVQGYCPPERLGQRYQNLHTPDELLLQLIESFLHTPDAKL